MAAAALALSVPLTPPVTSRPTYLQVCFYELICCLVDIKGYHIPHDLQLNTDEARDIYKDKINRAKGLVKQVHGVIMNHGVSL